MKIKTSVLSGAALDWAVAQAEGIPMPTSRSLYSYEPSTDWDQGGPIIEREMRNGMHLHGGGIFVATYYRESLGGNDGEHYGPTLLVAAMRCYVTAKLGAEIEVPDVLVD